MTYHEANPAQAEQIGYKSLLSPIDVGPLTLRNRVVMGAMHTRLETLDRPLEREIAFYRTRAEGGVAMIVSGGISPTADGVFEPGALWSAELDFEYQRSLTEAVRDAGSFFIAQLLHAGRYAKIPAPVGVSGEAAPINHTIPRKLSEADVRGLVDAFARATEIALECGYDGVELMGSEGYLINQFLAPRTNKRGDAWGGDWSRRKRFAVEVARAVKQVTGREKLLSFRISALELVDGGMTGDEIIDLAQSLEEAGVHVLNTGIGWHESRVPTVAQVTPRAAFGNATASLKAAVGIPVMASNRINTADVAEEILRSGVADLVSLCRPLLADAEFVKKARDRRVAETTPCIACNQACLDRIFVAQTPSCIVNPRACREIDFPPRGLAALAPKSLAVVGGGAAGMTMAVEAAELGHRVHLFEASGALGGQLNLARQVPGKGEFDGLISSLSARCEAVGVTVSLGHCPTVAELSRFDHVALATGVRPRQPDIPGVSEPIVATYDQILSGRLRAGRRVVILGAGGIGFDTAEFLVGAHDRFAQFPEYANHYGLTEDAGVRGGFDPLVKSQLDGPHEITMLQRSKGRLGRTLSITTSWIKRDTLARANVTMMDGVQYKRIVSDGIHISRNREDAFLPADTIILCTGQTSNTDMLQELKSYGLSVSVIGGAFEAAELDAMRAIEQAVHAAREL